MTQSYYVYKVKELLAQAETDPELGPGGYEAVLDAVNSDLDLRYTILADPGDFGEDVDDDGDGTDLYDETGDAGA